MTKSFVVIILIAGAIFSSCKSEKLTREEARSILVNSVTYPKSESTEFLIKDYNMLVGVEVPNFDKLQQLGVITYTLDGSYLTGELTEEGKKYAVGAARTGGYGQSYVTVKVSTLEFGDIT